MTTRQVKFLNRAVGGRTALRRGIAVRLRNPGIAAAIEDDGPGAIDGVRRVDTRCVRAGVSIQQGPGQGNTASQGNDGETQAHDQARGYTP